MMIISSVSDARVNARTDDGSHKLIMGCDEDKLLSNQKNCYMENRSARCLIILTCVVLSAMFAMLFGLTVTSMCKIQKLESQIEEMRGLMDIYLDEKVEVDSELPPPSLRTKEIKTATRNKRDATDFDESPSDGEERPTTDYPSYYRNYRYPGHTSTEEEAYSDVNIRSRMRIHKQERQSRRTKLLPAIHLHGDTSRYIYGEHENYNGNGHLHHPNRLIVDWIAHDWVRDLGMDQHFSFNEGSLTIKESGLYLIYAQIYYIDSHDSTGFSVNKNGRSILQCARDTKSMMAVNKTNTCFTAGAEFFHEYDRITIEENYHERYSVFKPGKSFFGVIKLGDPKPL